jgi:hypothetical protein
LSFEELAAAANEMGLTVNNCFQLGPRTWQVNLRDGESFAEFGHGETPSQAMEQALGKVPRKKIDVLAEVFG